MNMTDLIVLVCMIAAAAIAAGAFAFLTQYLFKRGLADRHDPVPNIVDLYKGYIAHTRKTSGRIGLAFWIHCVFAGAFVTIGVAYTILRFVWPLVS